MPRYDFRCQKCETTVELTYKMAEKPEMVPCGCGGEMQQIVSIGGIQSDEPAWLYQKEVRGCLQKEHERPIETRGEYRRYLRERNIVER